MNKVSLLSVFIVVAMVSSFANVNSVAAACSSSGPPTVGTDKADYGPFEIVTIFGSGFECGEALSILVTAPDGSTLSGDGTGSPGPDSVTTDDNGGFVLSYRLSGTFPNGNTYAGQVGDYSVEVMNATGVILASTTFSDGEGANYTCALTTSGGTKCWGHNGTAQLGDGTFITRTTPVDVIGLISGVAQISTGARQTTCAVTTSGGAKCWGANIGLTPVDIFGMTSGVSQISVGANHTCLLTTSGGVKCWGRNFNGELGIGTFSFGSATPVDVIGLTSGVVQIDAGIAHTCALTMSGGVKCWGLNNSGSLGDGTLTARSTPVDVIGLTSGVAQVSAGSGHTCAVMTGGGAKCWGGNSNGELGDGTTIGSFTPVDVSGLTSGVAQINAGGTHTCAVTTSGSAKCWGLNLNGQLGDGTLVRRTVPVDVSGLTSGVALISASSLHTCALTTSGGVKCWGLNAFGQLGDGTLTSSTIPVNTSGLTSGVAFLPDVFVTSSSNQPPTANAGGPYQGNEGAGIPMSSATASDPDLSDTLTYNWGANSALCSFNDASLLNPTLTCADNGNFTATLEVDDGINPPVTSDADVTVDNVAPTAVFGNNGPVNEGNDINLSLTSPFDPSSEDTAFGFDYAFDCGSGYGAFSAAGTAICSTDDNGARAVRATIRDKDGGFTEYIASVPIDNVAPIAVFSNNGPVNEGSNINLALNNPFDPSPVDTLAGFEYAFDCGSGYGAFNAANTAICSTDDNGARAVKATIRDKDGGFTEYMASVTINNVAPMVGLPAVSSEPSTEGQSVTASATFNDLGANDAPFTCTVNYGDGSGDLPGAVLGNICTGPSHIYSTFGSYPVAVNVTDKDNDTGSNSTMHSVIVNWSNFFQPVDNLPILNMVKAGGAVPVRFSLGRDLGLNIFIAGYPRSEQIACDSTALVDGIEETVSPGANTLTYDAATDEYTYVWKTDRSWSGTCRQFVIKLIDGATYRANFKFK